VTSKAVARESRRSSRVRLQVRIEALGMSEGLRAAFPIVGGL
jgi:hypothetical protein